MSLSPAAAGADMQQLMGEAASDAEHRQHSRQSLHLSASCKSCCHPGLVASMNLVLNEHQTGLPSLSEHVSLLAAEASTVMA